MRISDWSSDVCSSDLRLRRVAEGARPALGDPRLRGGRWTRARRRAATGGRLGDAGEQPLPGLEDGTPALVGAAVVRWRSFRRRQPFRLPIQAAAAAPLATRAMSSGVTCRCGEIGRASGRGRVCQYVEVSWFGVSIKKKKQ